MTIRADSESTIRCEVVYGRLPRLGRTHAVSVEVPFRKSVFRYGGYFLNGRPRGLHGSANAERFVVTRASVVQRTVVTMETTLSEGAKTGNVCAHFELACVFLEEFLIADGWRF